jgi:RND superfamily putative drug exporter
VLPSRRGDFGNLLGRWVLRWWPAILLFWLTAAIVSRTLAPSWESIAYDGDFEYLPDDLPSVVGRDLLDRAFPEAQSRSQMVITVTRLSEDRAENAQAASPEKADVRVALDLVRRLHHRLAEVCVSRALKAGWDGVGEPPAEARPDFERALVALDEAIAADQDYYSYFAERLAEVTGPAGRESLYWPRMAIAYWDRSFLRRVAGDIEGAEADQKIALLLRPAIATEAAAITDRDVSPWQDLLDVLTWNDKVIGHRLSPPRARLIILRLQTELAALRNVPVLAELERMIAEVRFRNALFLSEDLEILPTGAAAIGAETLRSSADAIRYTEVFTVALILIILAVIYRSPLLVAIPVISIGVAVICATGLVAAIASAGGLPGLGWVDLKIFTTSRIFVVVILFGAGTDYCLFLISRLREEAAGLAWPQAVERSLSRVSDALVGSAMTTVVGLAMLWVADFGKFHYSGPMIAICLLVALAVCTTLTPALLLALGPRVFWPGSIPTRSADVQSPLWHTLANSVTRRPIVVLAIGFALLIPPAIYGAIGERRVTYDLSSELGPQADSRRGINALRQTLPLGETNPVTLLVVLPDQHEREQLKEHVRTLSRGLHAIDGVTAVRTFDDPLGDYPPGRRMGLLDPDAWRRRALRTHRLSQAYFWSEVEPLRDRLARIDLVTSGDPFDPVSAAELRRVADFLQQRTSDADSPWHEARYAFVGTIPSIADLRAVTKADSVRIKFWVVLAVLGVLVLVLWRWDLSLFMIATVLISYYATLGMTVLFFRWAYGETYVGLDWKVPIFLFVILVAVGQDYNVYLVTRILEEQRRSHPLAAVRRAVARTGGIITSCGIVMAGTFFSMTASAWVPELLVGLGMESQQATGTLRGITELGFALGLGVLLDTFYVRTVLVPAFCVLRSQPPGEPRPSLERQQHTAAPPVGIAAGGSADPH